MIKLAHYTFGKLKGLGQGLIPVVPTQTKFSAKPKTGSFTVTCRKLAIVPAYSFMDYKSQGQTLETMIMDLMKPPTGGLSPFSTYVALSHSRGRATIQGHYIYQ